MIFFFFFNANEQRKEQSDRIFGGSEIQTSNRKVTVGLFEIDTNRRATGTLFASQLAGSKVGHILRQIKFIRIGPSPRKHTMSELGLRVLAGDVTVESAAKIQRGRGGGNE